MFDSFREKAQDIWVALRLSGVNGPGVDARQYVDVIHETLKEASSPTFLENRKRLLEHYSGSDERCSGRTLASALDTIATAIRNRGDWVNVMDHHDSPAAHENCFYQVEKIISTLHLEGFKMKLKGGPQLRYKID